MKESLVILLACFLTVPLGMSQMLSLGDSDEQPGTVCVVEAEEVAEDGSQESRITGEALLAAGSDRLEVPALCLRMPDESAALVATEPATQLFCRPPPAV